MTLSVYGVGLMLLGSALQMQLVLGKEASASCTKGGMICSNWESKCGTPQVGTQSRVLIAVVIVMVHGTA